MIPRKLYKGEKFGVLLHLWNQLIDHLVSTRLVSGKGIRLSQNTGGIVISALSGTTGHSAVQNASKNSGSFIVEFFEEEDGTIKLQVSEGFVCVNGQSFTLQSCKLDLRTGLLCVKAEMDENTHRLKKPVLQFGAFDSFHYPVAEITHSDGVYEIKQYPVTVASFMLTKTCVFAKVAQDG